MHLQQRKKPAGTEWQPELRGAPLPFWWLDTIADTVAGTLGAKQDKPATLPLVPEEPPSFPSFVSCTGAALSGPILSGFVTTNGFSLSCKLGAVPKTDSK